MTTPPTMQPGDTCDVTINAEGELEYEYHPAGDDAATMGTQRVAPAGLEP